MNESGAYERKIAQEAEYWGRFEDEANRFGVPWWCDLRRATKLSKVICSWMHDPRIENILRGSCKLALIEKASSVIGPALDIGCGAGWLSLELARRGMTVEGFEISADRLAVAERYLKENPFKEGFGSVVYSVKDMNRTELAGNKYKAVVSWDILHHIPEINRVISGIYSSLVPGGYFIVYDHIGLKRPNRWLIRLVKLPLMPLIKLYRLKPCAIAEVAETAEGKAFVSPFEDVSGYEMAGIIKKYFKVEMMSTQLCFLSALGNELLGMPDFLKYALFKWLKFLDDLLIATGLIKGEYIFIVARKGVKDEYHNSQFGREG